MVAAKFAFESLIGTPRRGEPKASGGWVARRSSGKEDAIALSRAAHVLAYVAGDIDG
jgi:hypothetical protein